VEVEDTGIGIEPEALARIFDPFEQADSSVHRRYGGLGLGLAISQAIAEAHGGTLTATSGGHGRGATFRLELPTAAALRAPEQAARSAPNSIPHTRPLSLLLVEDDETTVRV